MMLGFWIVLSLLLVAMFLLIIARRRINLLEATKDELTAKKNALLLKNVELSSSLNSSTEMEDRFESLARKIFESNQETFESRSAKTVDALLKPFEKDMKDFKNKVENFNRDSRDSYIDLNRQLKALKEVNLTLNEQAVDLTKALKGDSKVRGDWGEERLDRILEDSGFIEGRDYFKQFSYVDDDGEMKRPDCVVRLPRNRNVVIDSKVSLVDYAKYQSNENTDDKDRHLKAHINSMRNYIKGVEKEKLR